MKVPRIAVVLPVYNGEKYLAEAVHSVLAQTFQDFEVLVIDDGSTDRTAAILSGMADSRLRVIRFHQHKGLVEALNCGIRETRSELIAKMHADDICLPRRFQRQVAFMDAHPEVAICGTWTRQFGDGVRAVWRPAVEPKRIHALQFFWGVMDHPSIMMRRAFLERHALAYDDEFRHVEDFDFFIRAAELGDLANIPEFLLHKREHDRSTTELFGDEMVQTEARLIVRQLRSLIPDATDEQKEFHLHVAREAIQFNDLERADQWLLRLQQANLACRRYDEVAFLFALREMAFLLRTRVISEGFAVLRSYWESSLAGGLNEKIPGCAGLAWRLLIARLVDVKRALKRAV